ncbi:unnamed protein product [Rangifer tarandus platyrhynchus]|uniref:Uncharacterized protein n=1 Tax=Rangifer tarandus platyrhynchus TaxID=3082113 RepID=A0AC59Z0C3_RANTA
MALLLLSVRQFLQQKSGASLPGMTSTFVVVQPLSHVQLFATPWAAAYQVFLSFTISQSLFKLMSRESIRLSNHLVLCCSLLLPPSIFHSIRVFAKVLELQFQHQSFQ